MKENHSQDVLVIGSGAAGLSVALHLPNDLKITVLSKGSLDESSTRFAQGGIAAVLDTQDSVDAHVADTLNAGAGLCHKKSVQFTVERGKQNINWLVQQGVDFTKIESTRTENTKTENTKDNDIKNAYHLTQEGGHSHRRIIHSADATGKAVSDSLINRAKQQENIQLLTQHIAVNLITEANPETLKKRCIGAYILNQETGEVELFLARFVVLATGGASKAYLYTSNPDSASGDGIAMAWRAGCRVANLEFNQFHPTCLYHPQAKSFLITEALRGEGAKLRLPDGSTFMERFDERAELAPRDIVARAIDHEMKRLGSDCVYLDISHKPKDFIIEHFPTVYEKCLGFGIDITEEAIPVVPAAHYTCGGVVVDLNGHSDLQNLFVIGESSFTGLHGANRMASNSLLECFVFAESAAQHIISQLDHVELPPPSSAAKWDASRVKNSDEDVVISHNWDEVRRFMWDYVGIVRTDKRLRRAQTRIDLLQREIRDYYFNYHISSDLLELRNLATVAELIIRCAQQRKESRGLHYTLDYPETLAKASDTILIPDNFAAIEVMVG